MHRPSNAHETALAMEMAKHRLAEESDVSTPEVSTGATTPEPDELPTTDKFAFAFDIDGVLIRGGEVIPEAVEAMKVLNGQNEYNIKV
jgi:Haloacid dehalogenase-like hydrolase